MERLEALFTHPGSQAMGKTIILLPDTWGVENRDTGRPVLDDFALPHAMVDFASLCEAISCLYRPIEDVEMSDELEGHWVGAVD